MIRVCSWPWAKWPPLCQQQLIQQLLAQQRGVRKSLQQMMDEMRQAGNQGLGDLSGIANEMDEVLKDLEMKRYTRQTSDRQQRILSRMLDSQKSMTQRGFRRRAEIGNRGSNFIHWSCWTSPGSRPTPVFNHECYEPCLEIGLFPGLPKNDPALF